MAWAIATDYMPKTSQAVPIWFSGLVAKQFSYTDVFGIGTKDVDTTEYQSRLKGRNTGGLSSTAMSSVIGSTSKTWEEWAGVHSSYGNVK